MRKKIIGQYRRIRQRLSTGFDKPSWYVSLVPFIVLIATLAVVVKVFGADSLNGGSQVALLFASGVTVAISMIFYRKPWEEFENAITDNIRSVGTALLILLMIGAVAGTWMVSGVVPTLIYYGMKAITPVIFLFATCIISALVSLMTGSSWTTIATIGVALTGIGTAQGYAPGWTAGAIISGAYFGDKVSPLSDTTILASSSSGTSLFTHIRYMMITTVPSFAIACIVFLAASICHGNSGDMQSAEFAASLKASFNISPWLFAVPVLTAFFIIKKFPALLTLFLATVLACIAALIFQPQAIYEVANGTAEGFNGLSFIDSVKGLMVTCYGSTAIQTGSESLNSLISTRGMTGMLNTVFLIVAAVTFGGTLSGSGMLQSLTGLLARFVHKAVTLVGATVGTGIFCNMITGDQYLSIILTSQMYRKAYDEKGFQHRLLSRSVEDSATVTSVLIPWNSCGMTQATVLKVPTLEYLPYCFFNIISPLMSIFIAAIGFKIVKKVNEKETPAG